MGIHSPISRSMLQSYCFPLSPYWALIGKSVSTGLWNATRSRALGAFFGIGIGSTLRLCNDVVQLVESALIDRFPRADVLL